ncbi:MAG TPA: DUF1707 domain-containing protein [Longimicrobiales bacterium]
MTDSTQGALALNERRRRIIDALCRHFAADHLTLEEFERRVDVAHRTGDVAELDALLAGLPAPAGASVTPAAARAARPASVSGRSDREYAVAVFGGATRKGPWTPAERVLAYAVWGGIELDFREARLPSGVTEVSAFALFGGVEIIVPPGLVVESTGAAILGGFDQARGAATPAPDAPVLRVRGLAMMGGVQIRTLLPGESVGDAARREREERRRLRAEHRRLRAEHRRARRER